MEKWRERYVILAMALLYPALAGASTTGARYVVSSCTYAIKGAKGLSTMKVYREAGGKQIAEFDQIRHRHNHHVTLPAVTVENLDHRALRKDDSWVPVASSNAMLDPNKVYSLRRFVTSPEIGDATSSSLIEFFDQSKRRMAAVFQYGWTVYSCLPEHNHSHL